MQLSFEFFPPKSEVGNVALLEKAKILNFFNPQYFSVTFGAGGSTQQYTIQTVRKLIASGFNVVPHITCAGMSKHNILDLLTLYQSFKVNRLVVLRGDAVVDDNSDFKHANELVSFIRHVAKNAFYIEVAAYPEFHPEAKNIDSDIDALQLKANAGANGAITQYFYNADAYFYSLDICIKKGICIPIIPGIMPIKNVTQLLRFSKMCGAEVPLWLMKRLLSYGNDEVSVCKLGFEVVLKLCKALLAGGAPGLHFYTMNETEPTCALLSELKNFIQ